MLHDSASVLLDKQEVAQGELLIREKPFVYILCSKFRTERCDVCFRKGQLLKCSACHYVYYCDKGCQKKGWLVHKLECRYLKKIAPRILPDAARFLSRLIKILATGGYLIRSYYTRTKFRIFNDLMSHYPNLKVDQNRLDHLSSLYGVLSNYFEGEKLPNLSELMDMYGRMCVNSFSICNQEFQSLGTGMYLGASIVDHSCIPNAAVTFEGTTLVMRALERIPSLEWTKITISYIDTMARSQDRQAELQSTYYFLCQCPRCIDPYPAKEMTGAACPNSNCDNCIDMTSVKPGHVCSRCDTLITEEFISEFQDVVDMTNLNLEKMKEITYLDICEVCLQKHKGVLYNQNVKHVKMMDLAFDISIEFGKFDEAAEYGLKLVDGYYRYYGMIHPMTGLLHLRLGKLLLYQDQLGDAIENFKKARSILEITHGVHSSIFKEQLIPSYKDAIDRCKLRIMNS